MRHEPEDDSRFFDGCLFSIAGVILLIPAIALIAGAGPDDLVKLLFRSRVPIGVAQFVYVVPLLIFFRAIAPCKGRDGRANVGGNGIPAERRVRRLRPFQPLAPQSRIGSNSRTSSCSVSKKRGSSSRRVSTLPIAESIVSFKFG